MPGRKQYGLRVRRYDGIICTCLDVIKIVWVHPTRDFRTRATGTHADMAAFGEIDLETGGLCIYSRGDTAHDYHGQQDLANVETGGCEAKFQVDNSTLTHVR